MRTTVDLPSEIMDDVKEIAAERGASLSTTIADLTARGVAQYRGGYRMWIDEETGLPVMSTGRRITAKEVEQFLDEIEDE